MAVEQQGIDVTFPAAGDLSSYQYRLVLIDDNGRATLAVGSGTIGIGVLQNKPAAQDRAAVVRIGGMTKVACNAAVNERDQITSQAQGFGAATTTTGAAVYGIMTVATSGSAEVGEMILTPGKKYA